MASAEPWGAGALLGTLSSSRARSRTSGRRGETCTVVWAGCSASPGRVSSSVRRGVTLTWSSVSERQSEMRGVIGTEPTPAPSACVKPAAHPGGPQVPSGRWGQATFVRTTWDFRREPPG